MKGILSIRLIGRRLSVVGDEEAFD